MDRELLALLTMDDLQGEARELAETIGLSAFKRLVEVYGGTGRLYVPQPDTLLIPVRDALIRREYDGSNVYQLARKWQLSDTTIRQIVRDKALELQRRPLDGQVTLDDFITDAADDL